MLSSGMLRGAAIMAAVVFGTGAGVFAASTTLTATADANLVGSTVSSGSGGLIINVFSGSAAMLNFDLPASGIPANATITGATLGFNESSFANANGLVSILGYGRNGAFVGSEASIATTNVGSYNSILIGVGDDTVALNASGVSLLQSLLGGTQNVGLRLVSASSDTNTSIRSIENGFAPTLKVDYVVNTPEPMALAGLGMGGLLIRRRARTR